MPRLLIHVEGQTEETFVNEVLRPHLIIVGYENVGARLLGNARARSRRGGIKSWGVVRSDISRHLSGDTGCLATMMVDYYALPSDPNSGWPGRETAPLSPIAVRGKHVEAALAADFATTPYGQRFEPFVLMHEFEALLFSDCDTFANSIGWPQHANAFAAIRNQFATPEHINDSPVTAPSKRILDLIPNYEKPLLGTLAALDVGLDRIRAECPNFDDWLNRLEARV